MGRTGADAGTAAERVGVLVADPHPLYRDTIGRAIERHERLKLLGRTADGRTALAETVRLQPDVLLLDVDLEGLDGRRVLNAVRREGSRCRVAFLSAVVDPATVYALLEAGAAAYLSKLLDSEAVCDAILAVASGAVVLSPQVHGGVVAEIRLRARDERPVLTERERTILSLVAAGLSAPAIARRLHLGTSTVKTHLLRLYEKLGVSERAAAVAAAMRHGLLE